MTSSQPVLEVLAPGLQTTVQDPGRYGYGRFGVAASGALDIFALRIGNALVGNREDDACLETMLLGLRVRALQDVLIAVTGADLQPHCDGEPMARWRSHLVTRGQELSFKGPRSGFRAYLAVGGGIDVPQVMGSKSTNLPAGFGGLDGKALGSHDIILGTNPGDYLFCRGRRIDSADIPIYTEDWSLRVVLGPHDHHFSKSGIHTFLSSEYAVSPQSDRTGIRLVGDSIQTRPDVAGSIISEGVISGAIQVPGDGRPIVILNETVTGGYRKIATVIGADLPCLGQIKPGDQVKFEAVSLAEADASLSEMEAKLDRLSKSFDR